LNRSYSSNPALQPIKGIIIFHAADELTGRAEALLKNLCCQVLSTVGNRYTVKTSRGNLQAIKQRWQANELDNPISQELGNLVSQIIIGGRA
jgi:hypothetical protein